ncbi:MAG TPA: hypothetical protein VGS27_05530 [Candidatus Sulfotelmatobacter sp.]|nr:hypothetical protein [Candidatus Sulfotelmatobacter sp.]
MPGTLEVASSCVALSGAGLVMAAGVGQVIVGVVLVPGGGFTVRVTDAVAVV